MIYGIYKTIDTLPIINWHLLLKSQKEGNIELRYLLNVDINQELPTYDISQLLPIYENLCEQIPDKDYSFITASLRYDLQYAMFLNNKQKNGFLKMIGRPFEEVSTTDLNKYFAEYVTKLSDIFDVFEFTEYSFRTNYKEICKEIYNIDPQTFEFLEGIIFYHVTQFHKFVEKEKPVLLDAIMHPAFFKNFIETKKITINDINEIDTHISKEFIEIGEYDEYQKVRFELFNLETLTGLKSEENESSIFDEIVNLNNITSYKLDVNTSTVAELLAVRKKAKQIISDFEKNKNK